MEIGQIINQCHITAVSKGFPVHKTLQQTLLIVTEIGEALAELNLDIDKTSKEFINNAIQIVNQSETLENLRKSNDQLTESATIANLNNYLEELADIVIRVFSIAKHHTDNFEDVILYKMNVNKDRPYLHNKKF